MPSSWPYKKSMYQKKMSVRQRLNAALARNDLSGQETVQMFTAKEMKEIAKMYKLKNYSGLKRDDLAYLIMKYWSDGQTDARDVFYNRKI